MADYSAYKVDLTTPQPLGRQGESPRVAFEKYNDFLTEVGQDIEAAADPLGPNIGVSAVPSYFDFTSQNEEVLGYAGVDNQSAFLGSASPHPLYFYTGGAIRGGFDQHGRLFGRNLHNNAQGMPIGTLDQFIGSRWFTPVISNVSPGSTVAVNSAGWAMRLGLYVAGCFFVDGDISTNTSFYFSLPFDSAASDFRYINGSVASYAPAFSHGYVSASGTANPLGAVWIRTNALGTMRIAVNFSYIIR